MHFILSGAYRRAVRWRWVSVSPIGQAELPSAPAPNPQPPSPREAARIVNEAWRDPDWGALLWVAMTTGARRGELCALRWSSVSLDEGRETIWLRRAIRKDGGRLVEAELKTHQQRRVALDRETVAVLREHHERCQLRGVALGEEQSADAFVFSGAPDGSTFPTPDTVTQRYERLADRLGVVTTFHKLRHYSATELIAGGVDVRTVAGRLGHELVAVDLADRIESGELEPGTPAPTADELIARHGVAVSTVRRAVALVKEWGLAGESTPPPQDELRERVTEAVRLCPSRALSDTSAEPRESDSLPTA
jgi:integrase